MFKIHKLFVKYFIKIDLLYLNDLKGALTDYNHLILIVFVNISKHRISIRKNN